MSINQLTPFDILMESERMYQGERDSGYQLDDLIDAPVAVVTDIATSIYNSFVPEDIEVNTGEVLSKAGFNDSADFYANHRSGVEVASFVGGLFVPGALVVKGLRLARAGQATMFGTRTVGKAFQGVFAKKERLREQALNLVKAGQIQDKEYKKARRAWRNLSLLEGAMEGATFEMALLGMFNGHPFMDDYDTTDFILGTAIGTAFAPIRYIWDNSAFKLKAIELERAIAASGDVSIYKSRIGIIGTEGDRASALGANLESQNAAIKERDWTGNQGALDLAQRDQLNTAADLTDQLVELMDAGTKASTKAGLTKGVPAGLETDPLKMTPLDHLFQLVTRRKQSMQGVKQVKFFNTESAPSFEPAAVSDYSYTLVQGSELRHSPEFAIEAFEGGSAVSAWQMLTKGRSPKRRPNELVGGLEEAGLDFASWRRVFDGPQTVEDTTIHFDETAKGLEITIFNNDIGAATVDSATNKFLRDVLTIVNAEQPFRPVDIFIKHTTKGSKPSGSMQSLWDAGRKKSKKVSQFLSEEMRNSSATPEMVAGTRTVKPTQVFALVEGEIGDIARGTKRGRAKEAAPTQPAVIGYRDMNDMPPTGAGTFALMELPEGSRIATFKDLEQLADEFRVLTTKKGVGPLESGLDLTSQITITQRDAHAFLRSKGFSGAEITLSSGTKRYAKAPGTILFPGANPARIKRRFDTNHGKAVRQYRELEGIPNWTEDVAVYDARTKSIISGSQAMIVQGAADIAGGYRIDKKFSMSGPVSERQRKYNPYEHNTVEADRQFLDALHAVNRDSPKQMVIDIDDLPALQAAFIAGLGGKVDIKAATGAAGVTRVDQNTLGTIISEQKARWARVLTKSGYGMEQISLQTNMPLATVEKLVGADFSASKLLLQDGSIKDFMMYTSKAGDDLKSYLNPRQMQFDGDLAAAANLINQRQFTNMDAQTAQSMHRTIIAEESLKGASHAGVIGRVFELIDNSIFKNLIRHKTAFFSKEALGLPTVNSRDFALRKLDEIGAGELGQAVAQFGQDFSRLMTEATSDVAEKIVGSFRAIALDDVARIQFTDIHKSLQKIPFANRRNVAFDPDSGMFVISRDAKTGEITEALKYVRDGKWADETIVVNNLDTKAFFKDVYPPIQKMMYAMKETNSKIMGNSAPAPIGIHFPYGNITEKNIAYIFDENAVGNTRMIVGVDVGDLESQITKIEKEMDSGLRIIRREDAKDWNRITAYGQLNDIERADTSLQRSGILIEGTPSDTRVMQEIVDGITGEIWKQGRQYVRMAGAELFDELDKYTKWHKNPQVSNAGTFSQKASREISTSEVVAKTMLGQDMLADSHLLSTANNQYSWMIDTATEKMNGLWDTVWRETKGDLSKANHIELSQKLADAGIPNPWKGWEDFVTDNPKWQRNDAKALIAKANNIMVTFNLRLFEMAHAAITTFTIPIVIAAELGQRDYALRYMMEGVKALFSQAPEWKQIRKIASEKGYSKGRIAEDVTSALAKSMTDPGALSKIEENRVFKLLTSPSDGAEKLARQVAYLTGYKVALGKYGQGAQAELLETFANQFTNRTMGNYTARQRPTMFQGSLGATFGLYQTFMLSMFQQQFKFLEKKEFGALRNLFVVQAGMFGINTLPMFDPINKAIGAYTNDDNSDLTTTTFELFGDIDDNSRSVAEYILYGLPSTLFQSAFFTRGELQPRIPINPLAPIEEGTIAVSPPLINTVKQLWDLAWDTGTQVAQAMSTSPIDAGRAIAEGISIQSMWRPGARLSELLTGHSLDRAGRIVDAESEMSANWATFARVMAVRPLQEQVARSLNYSARYYEGKDQENRREAVRGLRSLVASGRTDNLGPTFQKYLGNGGSLQGLKSVMNESYIQAQNSMSFRVAREFRDRRELQDIMQGYIN